MTGIQYHSPHERADVKRILIAEDSNTMRSMLVSTIDQLPENSHDGATTAAEVDLAQALFRRAFEGVKLQDFSPLELDAVTLLFQVGTGRPRVGA